MALFSIDQVRKVYSGAAAGCMCGCKGNWSHATAHCDQDYYNVNDRSVKIIAGKVLRSKPESIQKEDLGDEVCYYVVNGARQLAVYVKKD